MNLEDFVEEWNNGTYREPDFDASVFAERHSSAMYDSFKKQFCERQPRHHVGVSELGKPAILLGLKVLGFPADTIEYKSVFNFHYGDWFESLILSLIQMYGVNLTSTQLELVFYGITGHIDGIVDDDTVLEIKTMSDYNYNKFSKPINAHKPWFRRFNQDVYGYATQLGCYCESLKKNGVWLVLNKVTRELAIVKPDKPIMVEGYKRARTLIDALKDIQCLEDVITSFEPPDPEPEFYKKKETGYYLVPESMKYTQYVSCFYDVVWDANGYGKQTMYVNAVRSPDEMYNLLEQEFEILTCK